MRYYSSTAGAMTLSASVGAADTTFSVNSTTGLPTSYPYTLVVDVGLSSEEIVSVTAASGTSLTVTRGQDGTSGQSHGIGAAIRHMASARDYREPQEHIAASSAVHGVTGSVVGTSDTQTLTNKTVTGGTVNPTTLQKGGVNVPTISETAVLTNKDLSSATNTFPASLATDAELSSHAGATTGVHGVGAGTVVGTDLTQTLTNKTISGASNTFSSIPQSAVTNLPTDIAALQVPKRAKIVTGANQLIATATPTTMDFAGGTVAYDNDTMADIANDRLVIKTAGWYVFTIRSAWQNNNSSYRGTLLAKNGTFVADDYRQAVGASNTITNLTTEPISCAVNDAFTVTVVQNSGGDLNLQQANSMWSSLSAHMVENP